MTTNNVNFLQPTWPAPARIKAYTALRPSNIGRPVLGESSPAKPIPGNLDRPLLQKMLQLPNEPIWLNQTHSSIALPAIAENNLREGDALFTSQTNQICAILTADCLPVLLTTRKGNYVAAIHAGWRGLASGIIANTLRMLNLPANEILVWLGPAIGPTRFEVRKDVYDAFTQHNADAAQAFKQINSEQWLADIYLLARLQLQKHGIEQIYGGEYCTHSDPERFFSYRRDGKMLGRMVSLIWITDSDEQ